MIVENQSYFIDRAITKTLIFFVFVWLIVFFTKTANADIIYATEDLPVLASTTPCRMANGTNGYSDVANIAGYSDNLFARTTGIASPITFLRCDSPNYKATPAPFPVGSVIDSIIYSVTASSSGSGTYSLAFRTGTNSCDPAGNTYNFGATPRTLQFTFDQTKCAASWAEISANLIAGTSTTPTLHMVNTPTAGRTVSIDSVVRTVFYHYDDTLSATRLTSFTATPKSGSGAPYVFTATTTTTLGYYYNSASDLATSTKYTHLQYKLYDYFTNTTVKANVPIGTKNVNTTSVLTNVCVSVFGCVNGDTYQLSARFSNADSSVVSPYFPTYYYFAYIAHTPTPTATTSVIIIGNGFDTGTTTIDVAKLYVDCGLTELEGCFKNALIWAFIPSSSSTAAYYGFISTVGLKAPMGYFTILKNNLSGLNSTSSPAFSITIPAHIKQYVFNPFDVAIAAILWFFFAINFYKRLKHITV